MQHTHKTNNDIIIKATREWTREIGLSKAKTIQTMGALQTRLVMHVFGKKDKSKFQSMGEISATCVAEVREADAEAALRATPPFAERVAEAGNPVLLTCGPSPEAS